MQIPFQQHKNPVIKINTVQIIKQGKVITKKVNYEVLRGRKLLISGPNGIGKSTLLRSFLDGIGVEFEKDLRIGYYSQDFSELNFDDTAFNALKEVMQSNMIQDLYEAAGRFMLPGELLQHKIESLSEGQKGLLCYARFMLQEPGLLIMDEPTNHINFRHIPVIAKALNEYGGALILISHLPEFVEQIRIDDEINLSKLS